MTKANQDIEYMHLALGLAAKAKGKTLPNPLVGAVIVKNNKVIGTGYHKKAGSAHAEIEAITHCTDSVKNSCLYVTLEPCAHYGRTPPCVDAIIANGIKRVVIGCKDPNPKVNGRSICKMRSAGIEVVTGVLKTEAAKLNEVFFKNIKKYLPFVAGKIAQSIDGKSATYINDSKWITAIKARQYARSLRDEYGAVLVGINTVMADDPSLKGLKTVPYKIIIDKDLKINPGVKLLNEFPDKVILFTAKTRSSKIKNIPEQVKIVELKEHDIATNTEYILKKLFALGIYSVFIEGGSKTLGAFFDAGMVDKAYFFIAPKIIGGQNALPSIGGLGKSKITEALRLKNIALKHFGDDLLIEGDIVYE
ncbi:MAG: bifunctional diaminohydroxyphosphoribosylaminopyrimidine deaminase/5-amino-6-(5-phosphoribosylamino)uracil reductase RibD [Candidatus Omnitrophica bacterium]|nr:bifunctional diaminohydroxyphosphoribosylaminopyrimidine deaminase/5-amino-6-(5-phosphoribosylamino)uracil reductase RibD [Candidatus Omnitrophota bacterium]MDD5080790.1 bifunctional diaminohydroxyphosphoribosylaminopyrimidine deaminase/5-amino-6-(5-phosphoribosylamino)uracil reductase RibD [Candidatus Omnitrophota bacterium]MDD5440907.1 bifunctional diaminohydroxyphosphoribosylaminopyrimidine deaminase/5-amino-6-(5-phosphoribosylamino)uracil reductase RibD [Candidatus Omnitrophota bacterium]